MCPDFCTINLTRELRKVRRKCRSSLLLSSLWSLEGVRCQGGRKICRQDDRGWYCWAAGQYGTLVEIPLESVYRHARGQTPGSWLLLAVNPSPVAYCSHCTGPQTTRVTVSQPGLRPSRKHQLWDLSHLIDHFYRSPKACLAITEYSVFCSYVQIQISLCIWYVEQISNSY